MKPKHTLLIIFFILATLAVACWLSGSAVGNQAGTVALGYAVGEQAKANQEMAHAVRTQANANVWIVGLVVGGMLAALGIGILAGRSRPVEIRTNPQALPAGEVRVLPPGARAGVPARISPEQILDQLIGADFERK